MGIRSNLGQYACSGCIEYYNYDFDEVNRRGEKRHDKKSLSDINDEALEILNDIKKSRLK